MDADDRARLTDDLVALADAYGGRGEFDAKAEAIERLDRLYRTGGDDDADINLANTTSVRGRDDVYGTAIDPDRLEAYRERIAEPYHRQPEPAIAAPLTQATAETVHANENADRRGRTGTPVTQLESVYDDHPEPDVAASLLRAYAHAELYLGGDAESGPEADSDVHGATADERSGRVERAEELFDSHPDGEVAGVIAGRTNANTKRADVAAIKDRIGRIEALADRFPAKEESVVRWLPVTTANAAPASFEEANPSRVDHWANGTVAHHERLSTSSSATWATVATFFAARASFFDGNVDAGEARLERLEALENRYDNPVFAH